MTPEDVEAEYWAHYYLENRGSGEEFEDDDFDVDSIIATLDSGDEWEEVINDKS